MTCPKDTRSKKMARCTTRFLRRSRNQAPPTLQPAEWTGEIELRGLAPGNYHVTDYVDGKDLGVVTAPDAKIKASFTDHLLLEVTKQ